MASQRFAYSSRSKIELRAPMNLLTNMIVLRGGNSLLKFLEFVVQSDGIFHIKVEKSSEFN